MGPELLDTAGVRAVMDAFEASDWQELRLEVGDTVVHLTRSAGSITLVGEAGTPAEVEGEEGEKGEEGEAVPLEASRAASPLSPAVPRTRTPELRESEEATILTIRAPTLGIFWRARHPGAQPFVEVGDRVEPDTTLCIVEVMKLMNPLKAGVRGVVTEIMAADGEVLARDQPLFRLRSLEP